METAPVYSGRVDFAFLRLADKMVEVVVKVLQVRCEFLKVPANMFDIGVDMSEFFGDMAGQFGVHVFISFNWCVIS